MSTIEKLRVLLEKRSAGMEPQRGGTVHVAVQELATDLGVSERSLYRWLSGEREPLETAKKLIDAIFEKENGGLK